MPDPNVPPPKLPPPPPKSSSDRPGGSRIYACLVGINEYQHASNLRGCVQDVENVESFLKWRYLVNDTPGRVIQNAPTQQETVYSLTHLEGYESLHILKLQDQSATYSNVINQFIRFFQDAGSNDKVWFHWSGHGAEIHTAPEFALLENGKDQAFMCHDYVNQNGTPTNVLADKEIAQLLNGLDRPEKGLPHILVSLDTCHSGGGTREEGFQDPNTLGPDEVGERIIVLPPSHKGRSINQYFGYRFGDTYQAPPSHVVMTGCNNLQLAGDTIEGGVFTKALIEALTEASGHTNYADLNLQVRHQVRKIDRDQTPQFDVIGEAKAYSLFLDGRPDGDPKRYEVRKGILEKIPEGALDQPQSTDTQLFWTIQAGAIHYIPVRQKADKPVTVDIYNVRGTESVLVAKGVIKLVGPVMSILEITERSFREGSGPYYGVINHFPAPPEHVLIKAAGTTDEPFKELLLNSWDEKTLAENILPTTTGETNPVPGLSITARQGVYKMKDLQLGIDIQTDYTFENLQKGHITQDLRKIAHWRRMVALTKDRTALLNKAAVDLDDGVQLVDKVQLVINVRGRSKNWGIGRQDELIIEAMEDNDIFGQRFEFEERIYSYHPTVIINREPGDDQKLYAYLFYLDQYYSIHTVSGEKPPLTSASGTFSYDDNRFNFIGLGAEEHEFTYYIKLILTTQELDYHQLLQEGIYGSRLPRRGSAQPEKAFDDWCTITKKIKFVRKH